MRSDAGTTEEDASLVVAPLSHGAGVHQLTQVARGAKTVLLATDRFDIEAAWALIEKWRITNIFTVPTILKLLIEHPAVDRYDHTSLRYVIYAGAPMYRTGQEQALAKLGPVLVQYFGLGEVTEDHDYSSVSHRPLQSLRGRCPSNRALWSPRVGKQERLHVETGSPGILQQKAMI
ncbi:hypothetical protein X740_05560 [Mesorhizobium sp. LNHC221B00]|nr:hypothetical protein X740_05560 [Mesorhizobium sp. LNHC221B00]